MSTTFFGNVTLLQPARKAQDLSDAEIRCGLRAMLHATQSKERLVLDELRLARTRAVLDVAVIDAGLHGYEIKSDLDSLSRLPRQIEVFGRSCDTLTLVTVKKHAAAAKQIIPGWWGLLLAERDRASRLTLTREREPFENPAVDATEFLNILRRTELMRILQANHSARHASSASKTALVATVLRVLGPREARRVAIEILRFRRTWTIRQLNVASEAERLRHAVTRPAPNLSPLVPSLFA